MCEVHKTQYELVWKSINKSLDKLADKNHSFVTINIDNNTGLSENDFLDKVNEGIESRGYEIHRVYNGDSKSPNSYGLSLERREGGVKNA